MRFGSGQGLIVPDGTDLGQGNNRCAPVGAASQFTCALAPSGKIGRGIATNATINTQLIVSGPRRQLCRQKSPGQCRGFEFAGRKMD
jgi:hypothetical protein